MKEEEGGQLEAVQVDIHEAEAKERCHGVDWRKMIPGHRAQQQDELPGTYSVLIARLMMMTMLAVFVAGTTLATWYFTSSASTKAVDSLGLSLREEILSRTRDRLAFALMQMSDLALALGAVVGSLTSLPDPVMADSRMYDVLLHNFVSRPWLNSVGMVFNDGTSAAVISYNVTSTELTLNQPYYLFINESIPYGGSPVRYGQPLDPSTLEPIGPVTRDVVLVGPIDSRTREFFNASLRLPPGQVYWQPITGASGRPVVTCSAPFRNPRTGEVGGVSTMSQSIVGLSNFMANLDLKGGYMFLTDVQGQLLATSDRALNLTIAPSASTIAGLMTLPRVANVTNRVIANAWKMLLTSYSINELSASGRQLSDVRLNGTKFFVNSEPISIGGFDTLVVLLLPRQGIMAGVDRRNALTIKLLVGLVIGTFVFGCALTVLLTRRVSSEIRLKADMIRHLEDKRRAEAESTAKSLFLANMSHELRTPMAAILGLLDVLLADGVTPEQEMNLLQLQQCASGLLELLNNLLDLSKIEAGKLELEEADCDFAGILEGLVDVFSVPCAKKNVDLVLDLSGDLPTRLVCDSIRIRQVFTNALSNAIKFTPQGGQVALRLWPAAPPPQPRRTLSDSSSRLSGSSYTYTPLLPGAPATRGGDARVDENELRWGKVGKAWVGEVVSGEGVVRRYVRLAFEVDDTGMGIPKDKRELVFENFVQADPSTTRLHGGTGLGLSIIRSLVQMMGGTVAIVDKPTPGTRISGTLLLALPADLPYPPPTLLSTTLASLPAPVQSARAGLFIPSGLAHCVAATWLRALGLEVADLAKNFNFKRKDNSASSVIDVRAENAAPEGSKGPKPLLLVLDLKLFGVYLKRREKARTFAGGYSSDDSEVFYQKSRLEETLGGVREVVEALGGSESSAYVAWIASPNVPKELRSALRAEGHKVFASQPLYPRRINGLLEALGKKCESAEKKELETPPPSEEAVPSPRDAVGGGVIVGPLEVPPSGPSTPPQLVSPSGGVGEGSPKDHPPPTPSEESGTRRISFPGMGVRGALTADSTGQGAAERPPLTGLRVLLVEDTVVLQKVVGSMLRKLGVKELTILENGQQAVDVLLRKNGEGGVLGAAMFDVVLMDCQMPILDGYESTRLVRKHEAKYGGHMTIIALTAHAMAADEQRCLACGMDAYLTKPINVKQMVETIERFRKVSNGSL